MNKVLTLITRINQFLSKDHPTDYGGTRFLLEESIDIIQKLNEENIVLKETLDIANKDYNSGMSLPPWAFK